MVLRGRSRELAKQLLYRTRIKVLYTKITLTPHTTLYFLLSLLSCLILSALQGVILLDNTQAVQILTDVVDRAEVPPHIALIVQGSGRSDRDQDGRDSNEEGARRGGEKVLKVCDGIPGEERTQCQEVRLGEGRGALTKRDLELVRKAGFRVRRQASPQFEVEERDHEDGHDSPSSDDDGADGSSAESDNDDAEDAGAESADDDAEEAGAESAEDEDEEDAAQAATPTSPPPPPGITTTSTSLSPTLASVLTSSPILVPTQSSSSVAVSFPPGATTSVAAITSSASSPSSTQSAPPPNPNPTANGSGGGGITLNGQFLNSPHSPVCIYALSWLEETLHNSQREDVGVLFYQVWLFGISLVAILSESLPHLGAAFLGHVLGGAWSASRITSTRELTAFYRGVIVRGPCEGVDFLRDWWNRRLVHTIPIVVLNVVSILALGVVSWKLFKVYTTQTFDRVFGSSAPPYINRLYKLILSFSVLLQLASFFTVASAGVWIAKVAHGNFRLLGRHEGLYLTGFVFVLLVSIPWLILGWQAVRRESRRRFAVFGVLSLFLIAISGAMFSSNMYRTIFMSWSFFATVTVTAFVLLIVTVLLGFVCFLTFGRGLADYLKVTETLDGGDFMPVYLPQQPQVQQGQYNFQMADPEKAAALPNLNPFETEAEASPVQPQEQHPPPESSPARQQTRAVSLLSALTLPVAQLQQQQPLPPLPVAFSSSRSAAASPAEPRSRFSDAPSVSSEEYSSIWRGMGSGGASYNARSPSTRMRTPTTTASSRMRDSGISTDSSFSSGPAPPGLPWMATPVIDPPSPATVRVVGTVGQGGLRVVNGSERFSSATDMALPPVQGLGLGLGLERRE